jgi:hypothetical protein
MEPTPPYPVRSVNIKGMTARGYGLIQRPGQPREHVTVKEADQVDKALGAAENGDLFVCPLCCDQFGPAALRAHAKQCIEARAPRKRVWTPPGFSSNATQAYSDDRPVRPGAGKWG